MFFSLQFGDSQKLRLVRILRSTVMVRVGGGWVALDEFLLKNDPCRGTYLNNMILLLNNKYIKTLKHLKGLTSYENKRLSTKIALIKSPNKCVTRVNIEMSNKSNRFS